MITDAALEIQNISFSFEKRAPHFFSDLSLSFANNKIHFIRGKNGSGKSTLFRIIRGNTASTEYLKGKLSIHGKTFNAKANAGASTQLYDQVKLVHQKFDTMLADQFTFIENLKLANLPEYPSINPLPDHQPIPDLINRFDIDFNKPVHLLSGGQRQILTILMALQKQTTILLLDEPTAALDEKNAEMVMEFLQELLASVGLTVLIICHDRELVEKHARDGFYQINVDEIEGRRTIEYVPLPAQKVIV